MSTRSLIRMPAEDAPPSVPFTGVAGAGQSDPPVAEITASASQIAVNISDKPDRPSAAPLPDPLLAVIA